MLLSMNVPYIMVEDNIQRIANLKIGVEIYFDNNTIEEVNPQDVKKLSKLLGDEGIVCTVHAPYMDLSPGGADRTIRAATKDKLKRSVEMANLFHAKGIVCHGGYNKWFFDGHHQMWLDQSLDTWEEVLKEAGAGLPVMIENIFEEEPLTLIELFGHFRDKNLYFCFDSGHFNIFSAVSLEEWLIPLKERIREMHLHDNHGTSDEHLPIGMGTFPFRELKTFVNRLGDVIYTTEILDESYVVEGIKMLKEFLS